MRCLNLLKRVFSSESDYYDGFKKQSTAFDSSSNYRCVAQALSILKAAKSDYENGYLFETRILIQADVFDSFLEQAEHLLEKGYNAPAAVIAGSVLENGMRKLCQRKSISLQAKATMEPMNVELTRAGVYNTLVQKRITALADVRNKAAHGKWNEFDGTDVGR